jgi:NAD(P)-dependent dehydrogenase (short-subunit alcohol dehydrogenase family)
MPRLEGSRALVIGGARRVGRAISVGLAEAGADVALTAYSSTGDGEATAQAIRALGRRSVALACNVRSTEEVDRAVRAAADELGGLDVLVYAAGAAFRGVAPEKVDLELFDEAIETILQGAFFAAQSSYEHLRERGGVIVFITDVAGIQPWPSFVPHSVAKAGLIHLTRVLAKAWAPSIRVCGVAPGTVLMEEGSSADSIANAARAAALGRVGTPDDVVGAVNYLVEADYVTGVQLIVDGGRLL